MRLFEQDGNLKRVSYYENGVSQQIIKGDYEIDFEKGLGYRCKSKCRAIFIQEPKSGCIVIETSVA